MQSTKAAAALLVVATAGLLWIAVASGEEEKQLSVYAPGGTSTVRVLDIEGREYADLLAVLSPVAKVTMRLDGSVARLSGGTADSTFAQGETTAQIGNRRVRFPARIVLRDGRVYVPLVALPVLLREMVNLRAELHEAGRRLFVENTQSRFSIELKKGEATEMALSFPLRVNPNITQDGNKVRLLFRTEPVVMASDAVTFNDPHIHHVQYEEKNGAAEVTVSGSAPLMVAFSDQGRTLLVRIAPAPPPPAKVASQPSTPPPTAPAGENPPATTAPASAPATTPVPFDSVRYFVMIDPGHGGTDPGVRFSDKVVEKDITLALARRLRAELQNRGIPAVLVRDSDATLSNDQRVVAANGQRAALYISLHAGGLGSGVRVYAPVLTKNDETLGAFVPWDRVQEIYRERSVLLSRAVAHEVGTRKIPARSFALPLPAMRAVAAPAIAIEVARPTADAPLEDFDRAAYQQAIAIATANAIVNTRDRMEEPR